MNRSESVKSIAPAFLAAQGKMKAAPKDAQNPHFKSQYSDFASVVFAVKAPLNESGISFLQPVRLTEHGVEIETVLMHTSGEFYSDTLLIPLARRDAQSVGSAISYGKRYALQSICGLPSDDDDGNAANAPADHRQTAQPRQQPARPAARPQKNGNPPGEPSPDEQFAIHIGECFQARDFTNEDAKIATADVLKKKYHVASVRDLDETQRQEFVDAILTGKLDKYKLASLAGPAK